MTQQIPLHAEDCRGDEGAKRLFSRARTQGAQRGTAALRGHRKPLGSLRANWTIAVPRSGAATKWSAELISLRLINGPGGAKRTEVRAPLARRLRGIDCWLFFAERQ